MHGRGREAFDHSPLEHSDQHSDLLIDVRSCPAGVDHRVANRFEVHRGELICRVVFVTTE